MKEPLPHPVIGNTMFFQRSNARIFFMDVCVGLFQPFPVDLFASARHKLSGDFMSPSVVTHYWGTEPKKRVKQQVTIRHRINELPESQSLQLLDPSSLFLLSRHDHGPR
mmetsp:Transcript_24636/g.51236  ORF Transcript_24636/g.51236 Transcript_24636/m.51236 type:complete len:109 (+) Transcript_24636:844-1170(+)